jgi:hypothetical protein
MRIVFLHRCIAPLTYSPSPIYLSFAISYLPPAANPLGLVAFFSGFPSLTACISNFREVYWEEIVARER